VPVVAEAAAAAHRAAIQLPAVRALAPLLEQVRRQFVRAVVMLVQPERVNLLAHGPLSRGWDHALCELLR
jgi:hypothetical protein